MTAAAGKGGLVDGLMIDKFGSEKIVVPIAKAIIAATTQASMHSARRASPRAGNMLSLRETGEK